MQYLLPLFLLVLIIQTSVAPPVKDHKDNEVDDSEEMAKIMEYHRYLKEVIQTLEKDTAFREKLQKATEGDIRSGQIAHELRFVDPNVRSKLDELKREELERLRHLATKEYNLMNNLDLDHLKIAEHLDHSNKHTFEIEDLKKLIIKTRKDLEEKDEQRHEEFKQYEMQKKYESEQRMKGMDEEERKKFKEDLEAAQKKHKDHKPLHHPVTKQQLEEVWEKQDHMELQDFNPKTFFHLHDLDGNGFWDQNEVKALFLKELDKLYSEGAPGSDIYERREEMERMREHVFNEADLNRDGLISYQEFLEQTKKPDFEQDDGWQGIDEQQIYSEQEYKAYEKLRQEEIQKMVAKGMLPPPPDTAHLPVQHEQFPPQYQQQQYQPQQYHPQQMHPSQQQYPGQMPPQQYQGNVGHQQPHQPQMPPQQQQQQLYQPHVPPQQHYQDQIPQQHQYQVPVPVEQQQPQQVHQQYQSQLQHQNQPPQQLSQQQLQGQPQQVQQQPQIQSQVPQHTQSNASSSQAFAQGSHNLPEQYESHPARSVINQNSIPSTKKT
ncbi:nucleobindin-2 isoform X2 [Ooceraea biroi]|uniref:nucleobindin-2 isoform X2 n=1 Tax=Ooceraea biroi TaxID=2015173 RepID=UPI0005BD299E|nr:nucleobindin-2 isoform X2 [Ooceraea biroi]